MDIKNLIGDFFKLRETSPNNYEVCTNIMLFANIPFVFYIEMIDGGIRISDHKLVCTFLSKIFDLGSSDVKTCIQEVLSLNKVNLKKGELFVVITDKNMFNFQLSNFLVATAQMIRMQAFFDKPEN